MYGQLNFRFILNPFSSLLKVKLCIIFICKISWISRTINAAENDNGVMHHETKLDKIIPLSKNIIMFRVVLAYKVLIVVNIASMFILYLHIFFKKF